MATGTQTDGKIQKFHPVQAGNPNEGAPSTEDAVDNDVRDALGGADDSNIYVDDDETEVLRNRSILSRLASDGVSFDPLPAKTVKFDMDANIVTLTISNNGAREGQVLILIFQQDNAGSRTVTFDSAKFQAGFDVGVPVLKGNADSRDYVACLWNATDSKYDFVSNPRRYP